MLKKLASLHTFHKHNLHVQDRPSINHKVQYHTGSLYIHTIHPIMSSDPTPGRARDRGVSVHWLSTGFIKEIKEAGKTPSATLHDLGDLAQDDNLICQKGDDITCPRDGMRGASYVDALVGNNNVGLANFVLITSWKIQVRDIVDTLEHFCNVRNLNPKRTYIWTDSLCRNLHRIVSGSKRMREQSNEIEFERMAQHKKDGLEVIALFSPWHKPTCLTQTWSLYDIYKANEENCTIHFAMPPDERVNMIRTAIFNAEGIDYILNTVRNINIETTQSSSVYLEKKQILEIIKNGPGFTEVNAFLKDWTREQLIHEIFSEDARDIASIEDIDRLCYSLGVTLHADKNIHLAYGLFQKSLAMREKASSMGTGASEEKDLNIASTCFSIGLVLQDLDDLEESLFYLKRSLLLREKYLGRNTIPTSDCFSAIGDVQLTLKYYPDAHDSYRAALAIEKKLHGMNHSRTATCFNNIGKVMDATDKFDDALSYFQQSLAIREERLGLNHIDTAMSITCMAQTMTKKDDHIEALEYYKTALGIHLELFGNNDASTALAYNNVAMAYCDMQSFGSALKNLDCAIDIYNKKLGKNHPHTLVAMNSKKEIHALQDEVLTI